MNNLGVIDDVNRPTVIEALGKVKSDGGDGLFFQATFDSLSNASTYNA